MRKLFGTDGIRAIAGEPPLAPPTIHAVGLALANRLAADGQPVRVLMAMDTRESGPWIAATIAAGLRAGGATVDFAGVLTTPAVAYLARRHAFSAGIVISASHNPWQDNGIKIFGGDGYKLPDATELALEADIEAVLKTTAHTATTPTPHQPYPPERSEGAASLPQAPTPSQQPCHPEQSEGPASLPQPPIPPQNPCHPEQSEGPASLPQPPTTPQQPYLPEQSEGPSSPAALPVTESYRAEYIRYLLAAVPNISLDNRAVIIDCANGAASSLAPQLFAELQGTVEVTHAAPNGRNINAGCGALHPEVVAAEVKQRGASMGFTFDGDADRALFADEHGNVVNGDAVMLALGRDLHARGQLAGDTVVATTMSNMGFEAALGRSGIRMLRAPVGDKYVLEEMRRTAASLGGEQSGHILFPALATTGDGLLTALLVLDVVHRSGKTLGQLVADLKNFPQVILNVKVREKVPLDTLPAVVAAIAAAESELAGTGRVVIRYSGTEALARVMIEAESEDRMRHHADAIAAAIRTELGL